jgi:hypothetical protein
MPIWKIWKSEEQEKSPLYVGSKSERTGTEKKKNFVELIEYGTQKSLLSGHTIWHANIEG